MSYPDQIAHIIALRRTPPLDRVLTAIVVDQTGVGRPVVDMIRRARLKPIAVTITAGQQETHTPEGDYHVSKLLIVSRLLSAFHEKTLRISKHLPDAATLVTELQNFAGVFTDTGHARFGAREGFHDDLVLACGLGTWWATYGQSRQMTVRQIEWGHRAGYGCPPMPNCVQGDTFLLRHCILSPSLQFGTLGCLTL